MEENIKTLVHKIQKAEVSLAEQTTACSKMADDLEHLQQQLGAETKEMVEQQIQERINQKQALETAFQTASEQYEEYKSRKGHLTAAAETLKQQIDAAGEAAALKEEEVLARREKWEQDKKEYNIQRDQKYNAVCMNREIYEKSDGKTGKYSGSREEICLDESIVRHRKWYACRKTKSRA